MHYDGLSQQVALKLEASSREFAMDALKAANKEANVACESDEGGNWRWNFGVYVYREEMPPESPEAAKDAAREEKP